MCLPCKCESTSSVHRSPVKRWKWCSLCVPRARKAKSGRSSRPCWPASLAYLVDSKQMKYYFSKSKVDGLEEWWENCSLATTCMLIWEGQARTHTHTHKTLKSKQKLTSLSILFQSLSAHSWVFTALSKGSVPPGLCLRVSWERKRWVSGLHAAFHTCPVLCLSVVPIPGLQEPDPAPAQSKTQGAKGACLLKLQLSGS